MTKSIYAALVISGFCSSMAFALDGQQFARAHEAWTQIEQASARADFAEKYLKDGNTAQVCFMLGTLASATTEAAGNLTILLQDPVSKGISEPIMAAIRFTKDSASRLDDTSVSTLGGCGGGGFEWSTKEVLSKDQLSARLQQISTDASALAKSFENIVYSK